MKIGALTISNRLTLAPMEEHTNFPFRLLMKQAGAGLVVTERIDAADVARRDRRALRLLYTQPAESPRAGQISGADPEVMAAAARVVAELGFNLVDLNFECPIRRLLARGEGGALMDFARADRADCRRGCPCRCNPCDRQDPQRPGRRPGNGRGSRPAGRRCRRRGRERACAERPAGLRRRAGLGRAGPREAGDLPAGHRRRRHSRGRRCRADAGRNGRRRRLHRPRLPGQPVDLSSGQGLAQRRRARRRADPGGARAADAAIDRRRVPSLRAAAGTAAIAAHERLLCPGPARRGGVSRRGPAGEESSPVPPPGAAVFSD